MTVPLGILAVLAAVAGVWGLPAESGTPIGRFLDPVLGPGPAREAVHHGPAWGLMAVSVLAAVVGMVLAGRMYGRGRVDVAKLGQPQNALHRLLLHKYYVDELYDRLFVRPTVVVAWWCAQTFDLGVIDAAVNGLAAVVERAAAGLRRVQTGFVMNYALTMLIGVVALLGLLLWPR
jgi:NADH-quinone oxidoreductase subunit L